MAAAKELVELKPDREPGQSLIAVPNIGALIKTAFERTPIPPTTEMAIVPSRRDQAAAFDLIDRAAEALDTLVRRCEELETKMSADAERARADAAAQDEVIAQWQRLGSGMKSQAEESDRQLQAMKARAEAAEARAAAAEGRAVALQQASEAAARQAAGFESLSTEFHDKVVATFGIGSRAHPALQLASKVSASDQGASAA